MCSLIVSGDVFIVWCCCVVCVVGAVEGVRNPKKKKKKSLDRREVKEIDVVVGEYDYCHITLWHQQ